MGVAASASLDPFQVVYTKLLRWQLVGGFNPVEKILVKIGIFPNFQDENKKYLKPPPSFEMPSCGSSILLLRIFSSMEALMLSRCLSEFIQHIRAGNRAAWEPMVVVHGIFVVSSSSFTSVWW